LEEGNKTMSILRITLMTASAVAALAVIAPHAPAATVTQTTVVTTAPITTDAIPVDFMAFDRNHDGILSSGEVGQTLFYIFDADGNEIIDNVEFDQARVYTMEKVKKEVTVKLDLNNDGIADRIEADTDTALQHTHLARFGSGAADTKLSAREFIDSSFLKLDINDDKAIDLKEWKQAYIESVRPETAIQERYNG
jgi:hypothetical protein